MRDEERLRAGTHPFHGLARRLQQHHGLPDPLKLFWLNGSDIRCDAFFSRANFDAASQHNIDLSMCISVRDSSKPSSWQSEACDLRERLVLCSVPQTLRMSSSLIRKELAAGRHHLASTYIGNEAATAYLLYLLYLWQLDEYDELGK